MPYADIINGLVYAIPVLFFIGRQLFMTSRVSAARLALLPALLLFIGASKVSAAAVATPSSMAYLGVMAVLAMVVGLLRGRSFRVWTDTDGGRWQKATGTTLALWAATIAVRIGSVAAGQAGSVADLLLFLGLSFAAQNLVLWSRAQVSMVPRAGAVG